MMLNVTYKSTNYEEDDRIKMLYSTAMSKAKIESSRTCIICNKTTASYCKSHSVPAFSLRNISIKQNLGYINSILKQPTGRIESGINGSGIFHNICQNCDNTLFQAYENEDSYTNEMPTDKILFQIAYKCYLRKLYIHNTQYKFYQELQNYFPQNNDFIKLKNIEQDDYNSYLTEFKQLRKKEIIPNIFRVIYYFKLPYTVPFAFQDDIALISDCKGNLINTPYGNSKDSQLLYTCIFPLHNTSVLLLFTNTENHRYRQFIKQFTSLNDEAKQKQFYTLCFVILIISTILKR